MTPLITRPLHFNTTKRRIHYGLICMTTSLNPIKPWRNATVRLSSSLWAQIFPDQYIQGKRNERVQKELDEQNEKLEKAKAHYTQLKSSAVSRFLTIVRFRRLNTLEQPSIIDLKKQNEVFQKDSEKLKKILQQYEGRRKKLIEQIAFEKAELANGGMYRFLCITEVSNTLTRRTSRASQDKIG